MNYSTKHIGDELKAEWEALVVSNSVAGFHQSFGWSNFKRLDGWETYKIGLFNGDELLIGGVLVHQFTFKDGSNFLYIPEGPVLNFDNEDELYWQWRALETALHSIVSLEPRAITTHIRMEPRVESVPEWFLLGWNKAPLNLQPRHTSIIDLTPSEEEILARMKQKGRYNIRLAEKKGVTVREAPLSEILSFYALYKETFSRNGFEGKDEQLFHDLISGAKEHLSLYLAEFDGKPIAGALVITFGDRATYLYGASSDAMRPLMGPYLLHWEIMKTMKRNGFIQYDLWGVAPSDEDEEHEWHGLTKFKAQFGGERSGFIGAYDYILQEDAYRAFVAKHEA